MVATLHTKYRPTIFGDVVGQSHLIKPLQGFLKQRRAHAYIFHGPSGCGKTTLARICAKELGCTSTDIIEIDGATNNGIDNIRALQQSVQYKPLTGSATTVVIVDECHRITGAAFDSMLKVIEEPPDHLFWFLCTTAPQKIPLTIRNRCQQFSVRALDGPDLERLLLFVNKEEKLYIPTDVVRYVANRSEGSPRRGLINLERCVDCETLGEASKAIEQVLDEDATLELARFLCQFEKKRPWPKAMELYRKIGGPDKDESGSIAENARIQIMHYIAACLKGNDKEAPNDATAAVYLGMLEAFSEEIKAREGKAALLLAIGRALFVSRDGV